MAEIKKGILGGVSGLVGTVVGATFRTLDIIRSRPKKSGKPPVQSQINQRLKFGLVTKFLARLKLFIDEGYKPVSKLHSPMNSAVQYNLNNAITGVAPNFTLDYTKIEISNGRLNGISDPVLAAVAGSKLAVTWDITDDGEFEPGEKIERDKDTARLVAYNTKNNKLLLTGYALRSAGTYQTRIPLADAGSTVHVWIFFVSEDGKLTSTSQYLGLITTIA